jgi:hypothetical protein
VSTVAQYPSTLSPARVRYETLKVGALDIGNPIDRASFTVDDEYGTLPFAPAEDDFIKIVDVDGTTLFQGRVAQVNARNHEPTGVLYDLAAQGWGALLDRIQTTAIETYAAGFSDVYIIRDILGKYWGQVASGAPVHVLRSARSLMPPETFAAGTTLRVILDQIATDAYKPFFYIDADKGLHWNDVTRMAPWGVSTQGANGTDLHFIGAVEDFTDFTGAAYRVTVNGTGGATYTATDWTQVARYNQRISDEPLAPTQRIRQLPDVTDTTLTTVAQCTQRAFSLLATVRPRRTVNFRVWEAGLFPGMRIDMFNAHHMIPTLFPRGASRSVIANTFAALRPGRMLGRFLIQRVTPTPLSNTYTQYDIEAGAYAPDFMTALARP